MTHVVYHPIARHINCLAEDNRLIRKKALLGIKEETIDKQIDPETFEILFFSEIITPLLRIISDPMESCRELSLNMLSNYLPLISDQKTVLQYIIPVFHQRYAQKTLFEHSEEIRLQASHLILSLINSLGREFTLFEHCVAIVTHFLADPFPEVRHVACSCVIRLAESAGDLLHTHAGDILQALLVSVVHQHSKLRKTAVDTIGVLILHTNGKLVKEALPQLAQRFFDPNHTVREAVARVLGVWLLELPDRYSYFANLIPLMLTCLSDRQPEIASLGTTLWHDVGIKFMKENEEDLKDKIDFLQNSYSGEPISIGDTIYETPNLGCRELVQRNIGRILPPLMSDLSDWLVSTRVKAAELLPHLLLNAGEQITQHAELLIQIIIKIASDEDQSVNYKDAAKMVGFFISPNLWLDICLGHLSKNTSSSLLTQSTLLSLSGIISGTPKHIFASYSLELASSLLKVLNSPEVCHSENILIQRALFDCFLALWRVLGDRALQYCFDVLIGTIYVYSLNEDLNFRREIKIFWLEMAETEGLSSCGELIDKYCAQLFQSLDSKAQWTSQSPEGVFFDCLLSESTSICSWNLGRPYFERNLTSECDPKLRLRLLSLFSRLFIKITQVENVDYYLSTDDVEWIVTHLIAPNIVWKAGRSACAVRTAALACLWTVLKQEAVLGTISFSLQIYFHLLNLLTSCLEDSNSKSRFFAVNICDKLMLLFSKIPSNLEAGRICDAKHVYLCEDKLFVYGENLLKRLDDSDDNIRLAVVDAFYSFFVCIRSFELSNKRESYFEVIFRCLLIHMDDIAIQKSICDLLMSVTDVSGHVLKAELSKVADRHKVAQYCDMLQRKLEERVLLP